MILIYLNWNLGTIIALLSVGVYVISLAIGIQQYKSRKYIFFLFLIFGNLFGMLWALFMGIYYILLYYYVVELWFVQALMPIVLSYCLVLALDYISRDSIDIRKIVIFTGLGMINLTLLMFWPVHSIIATAYGYFNSAFTFLIAVIWFIFTYKIYIRSPIKMKKYSLLNFIGGILIGIITPIYVTLSGIWGGFNLNILLVSLGLLLATFAFSKEPKLSGILPYKVFNITIIDAISGNSVFSHDWDEKEGLMNDTLFSSLLQAISTILNEAIRKGNVKEIYLDEAVVILKRSQKYPVAYVLITSKSSKTLRHALDSFADKFDTRFSKFFSDMSNLEVFLPAYEIIHECFPFVPEYD